METQTVRAPWMELRFQSFARALLFGLGTIAFVLLMRQGVAAQEKVTLKATPATVAWGYYDAKAAPVLRIKSGDTVEIQTLITSSPKRLEAAGVSPEHV